MIIAVPTSNGKTICEYIPFCKYFLLIDTEKKDEKLIENPMFKIVKEEHVKKRDCGENALHTGEILPPFLKENGVEVLIARKLGEGLLDNLEIYEIRYFIVDEEKITSLEFSEFY